MMDIRLQGVDELFVSGGSLRDLLRTQREPIRRWLSQTKDAKLLLILEDPEAARRGKTPVWSSDIDQKDKDKRREIYAQDIELSLKIVAELKEECPEKVKARLTDEAPSATVMMTDRSKAIICFNIYKADPPVRPVLELSKTEYPEWFGLFEQLYYDELWKRSKQWPPAGGDVTSSE